MNTTAGLAELLGKRIRNYRTQKGLSQEQLAELAEVHPSYIGQVERGEKNATVDSVYKIAKGLGIPLSTLLEKIEAQEEGSLEDNIPLECYEIVAKHSHSEQEALIGLLRRIEAYKQI